jgi:hypothetical protein
MAKAQVSLYVAEALDRHFSTSAQSPDSAREVLELSTAGHEIENELFSPMFENYQIHKYFCNHYAVFPLQPISVYMTISYSL